MYNLRRSIQHAETATLTADGSGIHQAVEPEVWVAAGNVAGEDIESVEIFYDGSLIETRENRPPLFNSGYSNARPFINANPYGGAESNQSRVEAESIYDEEYYLRTAGMVPFCIAALSCDRGYSFRTPSAYSTFEIDECVDYSVKTGKMDLGRYRALQLLPILLGTESEAREG